MEHHLVMVGNPFDGLTPYGPFPDYDTALKFVQENLEGGDTEWWIAALHDPAGFGH
jgi:hypothetical protein